jgi:hypothetical protein
MGLEYLSIARSVESSFTDFVSKKVDVLILIFR